MASEEVVEQTEQGPRMEFLKCATPQCAGGRVAVIFEMHGANARPEEGFVEREVARRGAFFPSDYTGGGGRQFR